MSCCWRSYYNCDIIMIGKNLADLCPCKNCVVRMICEETCDEFNNYYKSIFGFDHEDSEKL